MTACFAVRLTEEWRSRVVLYVGIAPTAHPVNPVYILPSLSPIRLGVLCAWEPCVVRYPSHVIAGARRKGGTRPVS